MKASFVVRKEKKTKKKRWEITVAWFCSQIYKVNLNEQKKIKLNDEISR